MTKISRPRETTITKAVLAKARLIPGLLLRKRHVTMGVTGDPDLYGSYRGVHIEIEMKRPGEIPTPLQQQRMQEWRNAGAVVGWADSVEGALSIITDLERSRGVLFTDREG